MKKLLWLIVGILLFSVGRAHAFDVYSSSSPVPATASGVLCPVGTIAYIFNVCTSSPVAGSSYQIFASTFNTAAVQTSGFISGATFGCLNYSANYGTNGLFYTKTGASQGTFAYLCN